MYNTLEEAFTAFGEYLLSSSPNGKGVYEQYYPKIRESLKPYLEDKYKKEGSWREVGRFLKESIAVPDIQKSAVKDVKRIFENKGNASIRAVHNYIIAFRQFYDFLASKGIENLGIMLFFSKNPKRNEERKDLLRKIERELNENNIVLDEAKRDPALAENMEDDKFKYLLQEINKTKWESLDLTKSQSIYKLQYIIMIKLFLLLGLKPQRLYEIRIGDYDEKHCQLYFNSSNDGFVDYYISLPNDLSDQLSKLKKFREQQGYHHENHLLITNDGIPVTETHLPYYLKKIKEGYLASMGRSLSEYPDGANPFTQTGLLKFGIIQMIRQGINPAIIFDLTGIDLEIYEHCQSMALSDTDINNARRLDSGIRSISTFDCL